MSEQNDGDIVHEHICAKDNYWWSVGEVAKALGWDQDRVRAAVQELDSREWWSVILKPGQADLFRAVDSTDLP